MKNSVYLMCFLIIWNLVLIFNLCPYALAGEINFDIKDEFQELEIKKENILKRMEEKYAGKDFSAVYQQSSLLKALDITETASGRVYFSHPGKMRWEYLEPERNQIISDGKNLWIYRPDENQVVKGSAVNFFKNGAGGSFLSDISMVRKAYRIKIENEDEKFIDLVLIPEKETPEITFISIRILKFSYDIKQVVTYNPYGDSTTLDFTEISFKPLDKEIFRFRVPEGTDILYME